MRVLSISISVSISISISSLVLLGTTQLPSLVQAFVIPSSSSSSSSSFSVTRITASTTSTQYEQGKLQNKRNIFPSSSHSTSHSTSHSSSHSTSHSSLYQSQQNEEEDENYKSLLERNGDFDLSTALFCSGLAFDSYAEPPVTSSRWERGSSGCNVAFQSPSFTRSIYKSLLQIQPIKCTDLPDEDDTTEGLLTGSGTDAYLLVAVAEGKWEEDIKLIENEKYNEGVLSLKGCAHVGRSSTAWSNVDEKKANREYNKGNGDGSGAYHIKSSWGKGGQAVWAKDDPFYLYVQDPKNARIVFTIMDDDVVGSGSPIGSTSRKLVDVLPAAKIDDPVSLIKDEVIARMKRGEDVDLNDTEELIKSVAQVWEGDVKLTSKPRKKDKNGQIAAAAAAGAMVAGPAGAAVGGLIGSFYEGDARGRVFANVKYMPIPNAPLNTKRYKVKGGLPGVDWGDLYEKTIQSQLLKTLPSDIATDETDATSITSQQQIVGEDFEFCCFVTHDKTGCSCAVYRSLEKKTIAVSFRGTCELVDLVTDASIIQESWVEGEDVEKEGAIKVHVGFRKSLNSISRKLKELVLASVAPGDSISDYDLIVTGHSLGGALATLFTADVGEYGIDAGRGLPTMEESEPWWSSLASNFFSSGEDKPEDIAPPKPKTLKHYNFGSPRVGNDEFRENFDSLVGNGIDESYRIVNGQDVVARLPRTVNALGIVSVGYEHCGPTVLISNPDAKDDDESADTAETPKPILWIEGQSEGECPVRDGTALRSPLAQGSLLGDIVSAVKTKSSEDDSTGNKTGDKEDFLQKGDVLSKFTDAVKGRMETFTASDLASVVGIDKQFLARESKIIQSVLSGQALSHHMEDEYYAAMGRACGFIALVGDEIRSIDSDEDSA